MPKNIRESTGLNWFVIINYWYLPLLEQQKRFADGHTYAGDQENSYPGREEAIARKRKKITSSKNANELLIGPPPRKGWEQYYKV
ncbi:hypothetical protein [Pedobacter borealis]|uniref:hypothetical protein n=1 Tax=Pedobacter borealis TaxID=475254 RepID=UPI0009F88CF5|nr:hypothetical protein [Pedobacter borealis]